LQTALNAKYDASNPSGYTTYTANQSLNTSNSPSFAGVNINGNLNAVDNIYLGSTLYHEGDTNTYLNFGTDAIALSTGGTDRVYINNTGVRLGDTGNGYFQPVSGNYGSVQIDGGAHGAYEGYSIGGRAVFMHDNSATTGLYNDVENEWLFRAVHNGSTFLYNNGAAKVEIGATFMEMSQHLDMNNNDIYGVDQIFHHGDTNTYLGFANDNIALVTGGSGRLTANNSGVFIESALHEDYDAVSGTGPTVDPNNGGAFSLTMSGNTTFTFGGTTSGYGVGFVLQLTGNGSTVTWPASVDWAGGTAPDAPASGETDIYVFWTRDGGTTWYGVQSIDAAA